jgi:hypothetical protein
VPGGVASFDTRQVAGLGQAAPGPGYDPTRMPGPPGASGFAGAPGGGVPTAPHLPGRPRFRRPVLIGAGALMAVAVVAAVAVVLLARGSPGSHPNAGSTSGVATLQASQTAAASTQGSSAPAAGPGPGPTIPAAFAGTWTGTAQQSAISNPGFALPNSITLTLAAAARSGQETNESCVTPVVVIGFASGRLTLRETSVSANCVSGTVTLTRKGANLDYRWTDGIEQNIGTLHKA